MDLTDLREYQPGDDVRAIDWNVTARMDTPYIRQYAEDREVCAWFLLDMSPSVDFGTAAGERLKRTVLVDLVATLARILTRRGNRVGAIVYTDRVQGATPARGGRLQVLRLIDDLIGQPRLGRAPETDLAALLDAGRQVIKRRSLVFVMSDFISLPGWERRLDFLNRRHEVVAMRLVDPREVQLPDVGPLIMQDAETGEQLFIDASDPGFRERYADIARQQESALLESLAGCGADVLELATDDDLLDALMRFADLRRQRARAKVPLRFPTAMRRAAPMTEAAR